ncbi:hypothetical protein KCU65_g6397, partial [Aureobasidium melanogenum]
MQFKLQWIPSHNKIPRDETADKLAKQATAKLRNHDFSRLLSAQRQQAQQESLKQWRTEWRNCTNGQHLRDIDTALPDPHTRHLYGNLPRSRVSLLAQLRTDYCWLKFYRKKIGYAEEDKCECGEATETVLVECSLLQNLRSTLRQKIGSKVESLSAMLGGKPQTFTAGRSSRTNNGNNASHTTNVTVTNTEASNRNGNSKKEKLRINSTELNAVLDFAEESQRFTPKEDAAACATLSTLRKQR